MDSKRKLKEVFERLYPNCELYYIMLNGFSHKVCYKDSNGDRHIDGVSFYAPEQYTDKYIDEGGNIESFNLDRTKVLFMGFPHGERQDFVYTNKSWC